MKNPIHILFAAFAALAISACSEGPADEPAQTPVTPATEPVYLTASIQNDTPAQATADTRIGMDDDGMSAVKLTWKEGDQLCVVNSLSGSNTAYRFTAIRIENEGKTAVFESPAGYTGTPAMAMWLGNWNGSGYSASNILPRSEVYTSDQLPFNFWLYAKYQDAQTNFVFRPLLPLLRFDLTLPAGETAVTSLRLQVQDGTAALNVSPAFDLTGDTPVVTNAHARSAFYSDELDIPLTDNRAVVYLCLGENASLSGKKLEIIVNKKYYATQTCGTLTTGKVAPIRKTAEKWSDAIYSGGFGTEASPYLISNQTNMRSLAASVNGGNTYAGQNFKVENDFSITTTESEPWAPIGLLATQFAANFDGNGKTIDGGTFHFASDSGIAGLFGWCNASVSNITFQANIVYNTSIATPMIGGIVCVMAGAITNCHHIGTIQANLSAPNVSGIGGIVARADGLVDNCSHSGNITTNFSITGGICGNLNTSGTMHRCKVFDTTISSSCSYSSGSRITLGALTGSNSGTLYGCSTYTNVTLINNNVLIPTSAIGGNGSVTPCDQGH